MIFVNYPALGVLAIAIFLLTAGVVSYRVLGSVRHPLLRQGLRFVASGIGSLSILPFFSFGCSLTNKPSDPNFSPDRKHAVRVSDFDYGATGGNTSVDVYADHGFRNGTVLYGEWKVTEPKDVRWLSDTQLLIQYSAFARSDSLECKDFDGVKVTCIRAPASTQ